MAEQYEQQAELAGQAQRRAITETKDQGLNLSQYLFFFVRLYQLLN